MSDLTALLCPWCRRPWHRLAAIGNPNAQSIVVVCQHCARVSVKTQADAVLRAPNDIELAHLESLPAWSMVVAAQTLIRRASMAQKAILN